ncbi:MAG: hypothetical protein KA536_10305 [Saprospiraceae bacterium]|nr:hypothetical protein [Saprospiraceae bacterium]
MKTSENILVNLNGLRFYLKSFKFEDEEVMCLIKMKRGKLNPIDVYTRIHSGCITSEVFGMTNCDCKWQMDESLKMIAESGNGIFIYNPHHEGKSHGLLSKIQSFSLMQKGHSSSEAYNQLGLSSDNREYQFAVNILNHLKVKSIHIITNNPDKIKICQENGLKISSIIPIAMESPNDTVKALYKDKVKYQNHHIKI